MASTTNCTSTPVGIKQIAAKLDTPPVRLRAFVRTLDLGVGKGSRYTWASMADPTVKRIVKEWEKAQATEPEAS